MTRETAATRARMQVSLAELKNGKQLCVNYFKRRDLWQWRRTRRVFLAAAATLW